MFLIIILSCVKSIQSLETYSITSTLISLDFKSPFSIQAEKNLQVNLSKMLFEHGDYIRKKEVNQLCGTELNEESLIIIQDRRYMTLIVVEGHLFADIMDKFDCKINQEVYVMKVGTNDVFETYTINNHKILKIIGKIDTIKGMEWIENKDVTIRRNNFMGIHLKAMVERDGISTRIDSDFSTKSQFHSSNQTYDVSHCVSGVVIDLLEIMKSNLNFTISYHLRKDRTWGYVVDQPNGSTEAFGAVGDVYHGRADMIAATPVMSLQRISTLDYLLPELKKGKND